MIVNPTHLSTGFDGDWDGTHVLLNGEKNFFFAEYNEDSPNFRLYRPFSGPCSA